MPHAYNGMDSHSSNSDADMLLDHQAGCNPSGTTCTSAELIHLSRSHPLVGPQVSQCRSSCVVLGVTVILAHPPLCIPRRQLSFAFNLGGGNGTSRRRLLQVGPGFECSLQLFNSSSGDFSNATFSPCTSPAVRTYSIPPTHPCCSPQG